MCSINACLAFFNIIVSIAILLLLYVEDYVDDCYVPDNLYAIAYFFTCVNALLYVSMIIPLFRTVLGALKLKFVPSFVAVVIAIINLHMILSSAYVECTNDHNIANGLRVLGITAVIGNTIIFVLDAKDSFCGGKNYTTVEQNTSTNNNRV